MSRRRASYQPYTALDNNVIYLAAYGDRIRRGTRIRHSRMRPTAPRREPIGMAFTVTLGMLVGAVVALAWFFPGGMP